MGRKRIEHEIIDDIEYKYCRKCLQLIPVTEFYKQPDTWDKLRIYCKSCGNIIGKQWRENHPNYHKQWYENHPNYDRQWRENHPNYNKQRYINNPNAAYFKRIKYLYGITSEQWTNLYQSLDGKCSICKNPFKDTRSCHTDHNHTTGQIRNLLCSNCNKLIGFVHEDTSILASMINYLKSGTYNYTYYREISKTANGKLITRNICMNQEWACAVCGKSLIDTIVCLDHDSKLARDNVRGCLCLQDNMALGYCHDDVNIIRSAISYLNHWELQYYLDEAIQNKNISLTH